MLKLPFGPQKVKTFLIGVVPMSICNWGVFEVEKRLLVDYTLGLCVLCSLQQLSWGFIGWL